MKRFFKKYGIRFIALAILLIIYSLTNVKYRNVDENLLKDFKFYTTKLKTLSIEAKSIRKVHPQYENISAWISAAGSAISIGDLDNDGKKSEYVLVDPRYDKVIVSSIVNQDFKTLILDVNTLHYNPNTMAPQGSLVNDFNEDGLTDVLVYYWGRTPVIFLNNGEGFNESELIQNGDRWFSLAATLSDFDGDGHTDIFITNYFPDGSKLLDSEASDADQTMQHSMSRAFNGGKNHFFLFEKTDHNIPVYKEDFNWSKQVENPNDWTLAVGAVDLNGDLLPEIYLANDFGPDKLLLNQSSPGQLNFRSIVGKRKFSSIASGVLGKDSFKGMGVGIGDINNDGLFDLFISNIAAEFALMESHFAYINTGNLNAFESGNAPFINKSENLGLSRSSWSWDAKIADFNNDGINEILQATGFIKGDVNRWPELQELAIGNDELIASPEVWPELKQGDDLSGHAHNPLFVRSKSGRFVDIAEKIGINFPHVTRGIAVGDMDYDGDLDFMISNQWEDSFYYKNNYSGSNEFIGLKLFHPVDIHLDKPIINGGEIVKKRMAIGALVKVYMNEELIGVSFVDGGNGHSGSNSQDILIGLNEISQDAELLVEISYISTSGKKQIHVLLNPGWNSIILPNN